MFPILRRHWALWAAWIMTSSVLLFANPWFAFGWPELVACFGSLLLSADRRARRESLLALGLPAIGLLAAIDPQEVTALRLVVAWAVFIGGVLLGARAVDDQHELEELAGHLALGPDAEAAHRELLEAAQSEIARARRHDRSLLILSLAPAKGDGKDDRIATKLLAARGIFEASATLREELHRYAKVAATRERVLCLVPEADLDSAPALIERLAKQVEAAHGLLLEAGAAVYPGDALAVEDLIAVADDARKQSVSRHSIAGRAATALDATD
ncbi:MAG: hypothetical protein CL931_09290 [Deltaproteobacteria bacterium]|nr:hypothetical protein [Deltaproteobacteria bacterium]